jgi:hypothetical protein
MHAKHAADYIVVRAPTVKILKKTLKALSIDLFRA